MCDRFIDLELQGVGNCIKIIAEGRECDDLDNLFIADALFTQVLIIRVAEAMRIGGTLLGERHDRLHAPRRQSRQIAVEGGKRLFVNADGAAGNLVNRPSVITLIGGGDGIQDHRGQ